MSKIGRQTYVFYEILAFLEDHDKVRMQQISNKFYNNIVPHSLSSIRMNNADHVK